MAPLTSIADEIFETFLAGRPEAVLADAASRLSVTGAADVPDLSGADRDVIIAWVKLLHAIGCASSDLGDKPGGRALLAKGYELAQSAGLATSAATLAYEVALVDFHLGQLGAAESECRQAIRLRIEESEDPLRPMLLLSGVLAAAGRMSEAGPVRMWVLDCAVTVGDVKVWADALEQGGHFGMLTGNDWLVVRSLVLAWRIRRTAGLRLEAARTAAVLDQVAKIPAVAADPNLAMRAE
jgi:hypothetical protein